MAFNPAKHHRHSIRLPGYDYSLPGAYFITMCVQNREWLFGEIIDCKMHRSDAGQMVEKWHLELTNKFENIKIDEYCILPDHFHSIIIIAAGNHVGIPADADDDVNAAAAGTDLRVCPCGVDGPGWGKHAGSPQPGSPQPGLSQSGSPRRLFERYSNHQTNIPSIVQWFKTMTTNEYIRNVKMNGWQPFTGRLWQRNYWEYIGRKEQDLIRIRRYIRNNPLNWNPNREKPFCTSPGINR
jgi:putative transposase